MRQYIGALQAICLHESDLASITLDADSIVEPKKIHGYRIAEYVNVTIPVSKGYSMIVFE